MQKNNEEVKIEIASCSNPKDYALICKSCERNNPSDFSSPFNIQKKLGNLNHTCDGYVNKNTTPLYFEEQVKL